MGVQSPLAILIVAIIFIAIGIAAFTLFRPDTAASSGAPIPDASPPPAAPASSPRRTEPIAAIPESRAHSQPESVPAAAAPFTFEGRSTAEIMAEFKDIPETEGQWSVGQKSPLWIPLDSFHSSETQLVISRYLEDYYERFLSPAARVDQTEINPDLDAWPEFSAWMRGVLELKMQAMRKRNTVAANLQKQDWLSRSTKEEIDSAGMASNRLADLVRRLDREIDRRQAPVLRKKSESAPASGR